MFFYAAEPTVPCCDICDPTLLNRTRPGAPPKAARQKKVQLGELCVAVRDSLHPWRVGVKVRDLSTNMLSGQWGWETVYGDELFATPTLLDIPPVIPIPTTTKSRGTKRRAEDEDEDEDSQETGAERLPNQPVSISASALRIGEQVFAIEGYSHADFEASRRSLGPVTGQYAIIGYTHNSPMVSRWPPNLVNTVPGGSSEEARAGPLDVEMQEVDV